MIKPINFLGKTYIIDSVKKKSRPEETKTIQNYARKYDVDVFVYNRSYYCNNVGTYDAIVVKDGLLYKKVFDMQCPHKSTLSELPNQIDFCIRDGKYNEFLDGKFDYKETNENIAF